MSSTRPRLTTFVAVLSIATPAAAQSSDPNEIARRLKTGDIIAVIDRNGSETRGVVEQWSGNALGIRPILPGDAANQYRTLPTVEHITIDRIAGLSRVNAFGNNLELVYQHPALFGMLPRLVKPGQLVRVTEISGSKTLGRILDVSPSVLMLAVRTENPRDGSGRPRYEWTSTRTLTPAAVARIEEPAHLRDGALKGMAVALAIIGITAAATCDGSCYGEAVVFTLAIGAGIGAGAGVGIDAAIPPKRLYRAPR